MTEKLVRDLIPDLIRAEGREPAVRVAGADERLGLLVAKLSEECAEFAADRSLEELADVLEVVDALAELLGGTAALETVRAAKRTARGGFSTGYVLRT